MNSLHIKTSDLRELVENAENESCDFINFSDARLSENGIFCFGTKFPSGGGGIFLQYLPAKIILPVGSWTDDFILQGKPECIIRKE